VTGDAKGIPYILMLHFFEGDWILSVFVKCKLPTLRPLPLDILAHHSKRITCGKDFFKSNSNNWVMLRSGPFLNGGQAISAAASRLMKQEWTNWSGSLRFTPETIEHPEDEDSLARLVRRAADQKKKVRVVGAGHSSMPLVATEHILVSMEKFKGVLSHDKDVHAD
jgi:hypothetical protein